MNQNIYVVSKKNDHWRLGTYFIVDEENRRAIQAKLEPIDPAGDRERRNKFHAKPVGMIHIALSSIHHLITKVAV